VKVLLDTNIIIHREASKVVEPNIGLLFKWLDDLHHEKCIHSVTISEIRQYKDKQVVASFNTKLTSYHQLQTKPPQDPNLAKLSAQVDKTPNDLNDSALINELLNDRVDILISEDQGIHQKAAQLGIANRVYTIDGFLQRATSENPSLLDYKVLAIRKEYFGNLDIKDKFFDTLKADYPSFDKWFNKKAEEQVYTCRQGEKLQALLYLKLETENEHYSDITPTFKRAKRLKIGTFKVDNPGFRIGERFFKIVFDNALRLDAQEIYVTLFNAREEQKRLIDALGKYGFNFHGHKKTGDKTEVVYVRDFAPRVDPVDPKRTYPYVSTKNNIFLVPIWPEYHTNLLPDSILRTELPTAYAGNEPFRNAISKVYISRSIKRNLIRGDIIVFYRTGGYYRGVITTIGVVEDTIQNIKDVTEFIRLCGKRSVFTPQELLEWWNYKPRYRPFIVNFLYAYSFPRRINLKRLIELHIIPNIDSVPQGFEKISVEQFRLIVKETNTNESLIVN
jgi:hypothetical protein